MEMIWSPMEKISVSKPGLRSPFWILWIFTVTAQKIWMATRTEFIFIYFIHTITPTRPGGGIRREPHTESFRILQTNSVPKLVLFSSEESTGFFWHTPFLLWKHDQIIRKKFGLEKFPKKISLPPQPKTSKIIFIWGNNPEKRAKPAFWVTTG